MSQPILASDYPLHLVLMVSIIPWPILKARWLSHHQQLIHHIPSELILGQPAEDESEIIYVQSIGGMVGVQTPFV